MAFRLIIAIVTLLGAAGVSAHASAEKRIAFTYDDGPRADGAFLTGEERTAKLIAALEKTGVEQAVFFIKTDNITGESQKQRVRDYASAGHIIANHSHTHQWAHRVDADDYIADIDKAEASLSEFENRRPWFRFPYLDEGRELKKRDALRAALAERELVNGYVTVDTFDWHMDRIAGNAKKSGKCVDLDGVGAVYVDMLVAAAEHFHEMALDAIGRAPAQVLLLHENDLAAMFSDDLAEGLRAAGWEIITADQAFSDEIANQLPETVFSGMGRVGAIAYEAGFRADRLDHPAADEALINARFEEAGVLACAAQ